VILWAGSEFTYVCSNVQQVEPRSIPHRLKQFGAIFTQNQQRIQAEVGLGALLGLSPWDLDPKPKSVL
jgi:hypothetical protein